MCGDWWVWRWVLLTSSKRVHKWRLGDGCWGEHLLGFANLGVGLSKLQTDGLRQIWVEPHALLQEKQGVDMGGGATTKQKRKKGLVIISQYH